MRVSAGFWESSDLNWAFLPFIMAIYMILLRPRAVGFYTKLGAGEALSAVQSL